MRCVHSRKPEQTTDEAKVNDLPTILNNLLPQSPCWQLQRTLPVARDTSCDPKSANPKGH